MLNNINPTKTKVKGRKAVLDAAVKLICNDTIQEGGMTYWITSMCAQTTINGFTRFQKRLEGRAG